MSLTFPIEQSTISRMEKVNAMEGPMKHGIFLKRILIFCILASLPWLPSARTAFAAAMPIMQSLTAVEKGIIGPLWSITEPFGWKGFWSMRKDTGPLAIYDATWKHVNGTVVKDVIYVQTWNKTTRQITFYRVGNRGRYYGLLKNDQVQGGTASWYPAGATWSGFIIRRQEQIPDDLKGEVTVPI